jgi:sigma-B regulation protein RsbU (phosphoserine phosphatase)
MNLTYEQKYQLLFELFQKIRDTLDLDEIMGHLLDTIDTVIDYDAAGIFVLSREIINNRQVPSKNMIAGVCWRGYDPRPTDDAMLSQGKGIIGHVIFTGSSLVVPDVRRDNRYIEGRVDTLSEIAVPILRSDRAIGALNLESDQLGAYEKSDLEVLQFFADAAAIAIEKAMLHRQLLEKELLDKQLEVARDMQLHLLPLQDPKIPGYDIAGVCIPTEEIGGDYYDYLPLPRGSLGIAVADVSGHGIASALAMTGFRGLLRTTIQGNRSPASIAHVINQLLPEFTADNHFISMVYGVLNPERDEMTFVRCGHPSPCVIHRDGEPEFLAANRPAFGIYRKVDYVDETKPLIEGDIVILYTDGVVEIENTKGQQFGVSRLITIISQNQELPASGLIQQVIWETQAFSDFQTYLDDFTLVILKKVGGN